jgi:hypothetical protein
MAAKILKMEEFTNFANFDILDYIFSDEMTYMFFQQKTLNAEC